MISNRKNKTASLIALLLCGLLFLGWIGSHAAAHLDMRNSGLLTSRIPYRTRMLLGHLQEDLRNVSCIRRAQSEHLIYLDNEGNAHEFSYMYGALWQDEYPFITDVEDFHFEYRDSRGNLLNANHHPDAIVSIGYVVHLKDQGKEVFANLSVRLSRRDRDWTEHSSQIAVATPLY